MAPRFARAAADASHGASNSELAILASSQRAKIAKSCRSIPASLPASVCLQRALQAMHADATWPMANAMKPPIVPIKHITHTNYEYKCDAKQLKTMIDYCLSKRYWFAVQGDTDVDGKAFSWFKCGIAPEGFSKRKIKL